MKLSFSTRGWQELSRGLNSVEAPLAALSARQPFGLGPKPGNFPAETMNRRRES